MHKAPLLCRLVWNKEFKVVSNLYRGKRKKATIMHIDNANFALFYPS